MTEQTTDCRKFQRNPFIGKIIVIRVLAVFVLLILSMPGCRKGGPEASLNIKNAWARPAQLMNHAITDSTAMEQTITSAIYMEIENNSPSVEVLLTATCAVSGTVELHQSIIEKDRMRMRKVDRGLAIPPGAMVELKPGGYHLMLIGLTCSLQAGDEFPVKLVFQNGETRTVTVGVRPVN